ncbi:uncharacterized protein DS421_6g192720 [Arachis hypogaea]|nr:uncharacterized protein DS421_6g192720 [Arachis hypogaea]
MGRIVLPETTFCCSKQGRQHRDMTMVTLIKSNGYNVSHYNQSAARTQLGSSPKNGSNYKLQNTDSNNSSSGGIHRHLLPFLARTPPNRYWLERRFLTPAAATRSFGNAAATRAEQRRAHQHGGDGSSATVSFARVPLFATQTAADLKIITRGGCSGVQAPATAWMDPRRRRAQTTAWRWCNVNNRTQLLSLLAFCSTALSLPLPFGGDDEKHGNWARQRRRQSRSPSPLRSLSLPRSSSSVDLFPSSLSFLYFFL